MALRITNKQMSTTGKRVDFTATKSGFLSKTRVFKMRFVAGDPLPEGEDFIDAVDEVLSKESAWKTGKRSKYLRLPALNATAYILCEPSAADEEE